jgi:hypothetical protein
MKLNGACTGRHATIFQRKPVGNSKIGIIVVSVIYPVYSDHRAAELTILRRALSGIDSRSAVFANYAALVTICGAAFQARDLAWF